MGICSTGPEICVDVSSWPVGERSLGGAMTSRTAHSGGATIGGGVRAHHGLMVRRVTR
jgi:hypothetical protein